MFCLYISLSISYQSSLILSPSFPSHPISFNHLPCSRYAYHPVLFCSISFLSTHPISSHPIFSLVFDLLSSFLIQSHVVSHPISAIPTHFISLSHVISVLIQCHPVSSHPIILHFLLPIYFFLSYLLLKL